VQICYYFVSYYCEVITLSASSLWSSVQLTGRCYLVLMFLWINGIIILINSNKRLCSAQHLASCLSASNFTEKLLVRWLLTKILPETWKNWLNSGSHVLLDSDPGIVHGFIILAIWGIFPLFGSYLWKNWSELCENKKFYHGRNFGQGRPR